MSKKLIKEYNHEYSDLDDLKNKYLNHQRAMRQPSVMKSGLMSTTKFFLGEPHAIEIKIYQYKDDGKEGTIDERGTEEGS